MFLNLFKKPENVLNVFNILLGLKIANVHTVGLDPTEILLQNNWASAMIWGSDENDRMTSIWNKGMKKQTHYNPIPKHPNLDSYKNPDEIRVISVAIR